MGIATTASVIVATDRDVKHMAAASHPVRVPDLAGSAVLDRAAAVRTDSARAIDPVRAVAAVVQVRVRVKVKVKAGVLVPAAVAGADDS